MRMVGMRCLQPLTEDAVDAFLSFHGSVFFSTPAIQAHGHDTEGTNDNDSP